MLRVLAHIAELYQSQDADAARLRAALLGAVRRLTPAAMLANLGSASVVLWGFGAGAGPGLWAWFAGVALLSALALLVWWRHRARPQPEAASTRALRKASQHTVLLAALWAALPVGWFAGQPPELQLLVATLVTGMLCAGAYMLSPLPLASIAWGSLLTLAALGALWLDGRPGMAGIAVLLLFYGPVVVLGALAAGRRHVAMLREQTRSARQQRMLAVLLHDFEQQADDLLWQTDGRGVLSHQPPRLAVLVGVPAAELAGQPLLPLLRARAQAGMPALEAALAAGRPFRDVVLVLQSGPGAPLRHLAIQGKPLLDERGQAQGWRGVASDVSERVLAQQQLQQLAHSDSLTGLANRHSLRLALGQALAGGQPVAVLALDLDHFKFINDSLGHTTGDAVLEAVAERLRAAVRPGDLVARLGGDEFLLMLPGPTALPLLEALAQRLIDSVTRPVERQGRQLQVGVSIGIAVAEAPGLTVDALLQQADTALYEAKAQGRCRHVVYRAELGARSQRRLALEQGLRDALAHDALQLLWQPQVALEGWRIVGAEALLRWQHPQLGPVAPAEFVPVAEQCGLIDDIGHRVLAQACQAGVGALDGLRIGVNVSAVQLRRPDFVPRLRALLRDTGMPPARLELEITESVVLGDSDGGFECLRALRALGVRIALDDFGTGFSSLASLRRFGFDTLKIDRGFVGELPLREDARAIMRSIAEMARALGMSSLCEGVETPQELAAVRQCGVLEVQGHLVAAPQPLAALQQLRAS